MDASAFILKHLQVKSYKFIVIINLVMYFLKLVISIMTIWTIYIAPKLQKLFYAITL